MPGCQLEERSGQEMRYTFCPKCGGRLGLNERNEIARPACTTCGFIFYQNPIVSVAAILIRDGKVYQEYR